LRPPLLLHWPFELLEAGAVYVLIIINYL